MEKRKPATPGHPAGKRPAKRPGQKPKAATKDIVGNLGEPEHIPPRWRRNYEHLVQLREHFLNRQTDLSKDASEEQPSFSLHMADAGTDSYDRDFALGMLSSEQDALYQIEQAIDRIRNGTYGKCELTGKPIEPARLEAIPWARFSVEAERELERQGARRHSGLGPRDTVAKAVPPSDQTEEPDA